MQDTLRDAAALSTRYYGSAGANAPAGEWSTLLRIVLEHAKPFKKERDWSWIAESSLATPHSTAGQSNARLAEVLQSACQARSKAGLVRALAEWWQSRIGDANALWVFQSRSLTHWQNDLRALRGVNWELADRILLFVGRRAVYPLDRGSMRIALRHGWMDATAEYDDWQAFFGSVERDFDVDRAALWESNVRLSRDFCRRVPDCEHCPLKPLLPARGPVPLDEQQ